MSASAAPTFSTTREGDLTLDDHEAIAIERGWLGDATLATTVRLAMSIFATFPSPLSVA